ncbi:MAG TPA: hypothetical protein PK167_10150 [Prolixibacteraceae bacterium]|nr:hypothetical protein [Prolixibacteraceae bacterium]
MESRNLCPTSIATILACRSIAHSFAENIFELSHLRRGWNYQYAESLKKKVDEIIRQYFSGGQYQPLTEKMELWREIMISALTDLAIVRAAVKVDFKNDKSFQKEFFEKHGFSEYFSEAKNGDHLSLYRFVQQFATALTPETRARITAGGLDVHVVDRILEDALEMREFNECFELMKNPGMVGNEALKEVGQIYEEIKDICRITTAYYYFEPAKRESFSFFKALRNLQPAGMLA